MPLNLAYMKYPKYPIEKRENPFVFLFVSDGPHGKIKKGVYYAKIGSNLFNLGFGDAIIPDGYSS